MIYDRTLQASYGVIRVRTLCGDGTISEEIEHPSGYAGTLFTIWGSSEVYDVGDCDTVTRVCAEVHHFGARMLAMLDARLEA
jgi:hypothetical protein